MQISALSFEITAMEKQSQEKPPKVLFPLIALVEKNYYYLCLWSDQCSKTVCMQRHGSFEDVVDHLKKTHQIKLKVGVDFCPTCKVIFENSTQAAEHYVTHAIEYESHSLSYESSTEPLNMKNNQHLVEKLRAVRKVLLTTMIFKDTLWQNDQHSLF